MADVPKITEKQRHVLQGLNGYVDAPTARRLADRLERPTFRSASFAYDEVYGQLRALERKALIRRVPRPPAARRGGTGTKWAGTKWELTDPGRWALSEGA